MTMPGLTLAGRVRPPAVVAAARRRHPASRHQLPRRPGPEGNKHDHRATGHQVRVLGTEGLRSRFEPAGAGFRAYRYAPDNDTRQPETDLLKE